jgi:peroxiredoxin
MSTDTDGLSLAEQLAAKAASVRRPEAAKKALNDAFDEIERRGLVPGIAVGAIAPSFELPDATGQRVSLAERLQGGPVVLLFYRGDWCPYCNLELRAYQKRLPEFRELGASLVAISPQAPDDAMTMRERHDLEFDVLSDLDQHVIESYRIRFELPASVKPHLLEDTAAALARQQPDGRWSLPVPATFVLDHRGTVLARHVTMQYRTRMEPDDALEALRQAGYPRP